MREGWARWRLSSITARLIAGLTVIITLLWLGAAGWAIYIASTELNEAFDHTLQETAKRLLPLATDDTLGHEDDDARAISHFIQGDSEYLSYQLSDAKGKVLLRSPDAPSGPYAKTPVAGFSTVGGYRLFTGSDSETGLTITVAETTDGRREAVIGGARALLWPLVLLVPLNVLAIWLAVAGAMRPVRRLSADIAVRGAGNLSALDTTGQPAELQPIALATSRLVERLAAALDAERAFAAHSAHELRTPIAGALAQTQRLIASLEGAGDRRRARDLEATLKRLAELAEKLMQLARADAGIALASNPIDLMPALNLVVDDARKRLGEAGSIAYMKDEDARLLAPMDADAFAIAARNLIDNAFNHGAESHEIEVTVGDGVVKVVNGGPVVPASVLAGLKERFARGDTRSQGSGLGLAIVDSLMAQVGGRLELYSPAEDRSDGFEARLNLGKA